MKWLDKLLSLGKAERPADYDGVPPRDIAALITEWIVEPGGDRPWSVVLKDVPAGAKLLALPPRACVAAIRLTLERELSQSRGMPQVEPWRSSRSGKLVSELSRRILPFTTAEAAEILELFCEVQHHSDWLRYKPLPKAIARSAQAAGWLASLHPQFERVREVLVSKRAALSADGRRLVKEIESLLLAAAGAPPADFRIERDVWGEQALAALKEMEGDHRRRWQLALNYCASAKGASPSAKWLAAGEDTIALLGKDEFAALACGWLALLDGPGPRRDAGHVEQRTYIVGEANGDVLRGMAWLLIHVPDETVAAALGNAAVAAFRKIPNFGARSAKAGNACLHTLKRFPGLLGAQQLATMRPRVKQPSHAAAVGKALAECAARLNMTTGETEELATPDHGFAGGRRSVRFGEHAAELTLDGASVVVSWRGAEGKAQKTEPALVKREYLEERKALKSLVGEVEKTLAAIRDRLERLPLASREWPLGAWRERYFDHPLAASLARRLIWRFRGAADTAALWDGERWIGESGAAVDIEGSTVLPWHPVFAEAESVRRWRALLTVRGIVQPFKQAHREIYLLTDAERNTRIYSNRFAAHVLRQHQFASLCIARGWRYRLQGDFDSHNYPELALPQWGFGVEFWVDATNDRADIAPSGINLHVLTDQVRFVRLDGAREPVPLDEIPPIVLSEVMRDVDLFVGVTSVGNDPTWNDGGPGGHYRAYWHAYAFGVLSTAAQMRKEVIAELLPRLSIRDKVEIDGKFLVVRGIRRTYKIHLGSGNILMLPNDQYLCIVPMRTKEKVDLRLPFEGDSVIPIILSKAFLLANDDRIEDASINRQIGAAVK